MAEDDYHEPNLDAEDPDLTPQNHWRMTLPLMLLVVIPVACIYALAETTGRPPWPSHNSWLHGNVPERLEAVGTSGRTDSATVPADTADTTVIREVGSIAANPRQFVGRRVDLQVPVAERANDEAFWIGDKDKRVLVVMGRDRRDGAERQDGRLADSGIAPLEVGKTASISGSIQKLPAAEETFSWGLTRLDTRQAGSMGVYLRADRVDVR